MTKLKLLIYLKRTLLTKALFLSFFVWLLTVSINIFMIFGRTSNLLCCNIHSLYHALHQNALSTKLKISAIF